MKCVANRCITASREVAEKMLIRISIKIFVRRACVHILIQKYCGFQNIWKTNVSKFYQGLARAQADLGFIISFRNGDKSHDVLMAKT